MDGYTEAAVEQVLQLVKRSAQFQDLGFARVDHHRELRQGFPEVVFGSGKTPEQIATIAAEIVAARPHAARDPRDRRRVRRRSEEEVPGATFIPVALHHHVPPEGRSARPRHDSGRRCGHVRSSGGRGSVRDRRSDGQHGRSLFDVGVAGIHRLAREHVRWSARAVIVVAGMEGALPSVIGGLVRVPGDRRADQRRIRRELRRPAALLGHAEQLRRRRVGRQHRQRLRRGAMPADQSF